MTTFTLYTFFYSLRIFQKPKEKPGHVPLDSVTYNRPCSLLRPGSPEPGPVTTEVGNVKVEPEAFLLKGRLLTRAPVWAVGLEKATWNPFQPCPWRDEALTLWFWLN